MTRLVTNSDGSIDVAKLGAGLLIGLVLIGVTVYLWITPGQGPNGDKMFEFTKIVITGFLGIAIGESGR